MRHIRDTTQLSYRLRCTFFVGHSDNSYAKVMGDRVSSVAFCESEVIFPSIAIYHGVLGGRASIDLEELAVWCFGDSL